jgi:glycosyltransferase involved in cell wall biosynthesis
VPDVWEQAWTTRHHVLTRLSRYFPVIWMDPPVEWRHAWSAAGRRPRARGLPAHGDFIVHRPGRFLPHVYRPRLVHDFIERVRLGRARRLLRSRGAAPAILYLWRPEFAPAVHRVAHQVTCYHVDDEYSFSPTELPVAAREAELLRTVDQVIIHSPGLWEKYAPLASRPARIPNGVDFRAYATPAPEPEDLRNVPHPRVGYIGVIKRQLDFPLLLTLATRRPDWSFVLVGPVRHLAEDEEPFSHLRRLPNVHCIGERAVSALPGYAQHFDVGIMPYDLNDYTRYIYPLKLHEYLAAGLPVVGTPIRTLQDFPDVVSTARNAEEWVAAIAKCLLPAARDPALIAARRDAARGHDWDALVARIALLLAERLGGPWPRAVAGMIP